MNKRKFGFEKYSDSQIVLFLCGFEPSGQDQKIGDINELENSKRTLTFEVYQSYLWKKKNFVKVFYKDPLESESVFGELLQSFPIGGKSLWNLDLATCTLIERSQLEKKLTLWVNAMLRKDALEENYWQELLLYIHNLGMVHEEAFIQELKVGTKRFMNAYQSKNRYFFREKSFFERISEFF